MTLTSTFRRLAAATLVTTALSGPAAAASATASYVINLGGTIIATANFTLTDDTGGATGKMHIGYFGAHLDNTSKN